MTYKDKDKQREANRQAQARFKAKTKGITEQGITNQKIANKVIPNMRRGKDIKCFEDLHPEIQRTIECVSTDKDGKLDEDEKKKRTAIAVHYQHLFPERYEPKSMAMSGDYPMTASERANYKLASELAPGEFNHVSKPGDPDYDGICTPEWIADKKRVDQAEDAAGCVAAPAERKER